MEEVRSEHRACVEALQGLKEFIEAIQEQKEVAEQRGAALEGQIGVLEGKLAEQQVPMRAAQYSGWHMTHTYEQQVPMRAAQWGMIGVWCM